MVERTCMIVGLLCLAVGVTQGANISINEPFTGSSLPAGYTEAYSGTGDGEIFYTAEGVEFDRGEDADSGRNYVRTADTDYNTVSFTAELTVTAALGGGEYGNSSQFFFGLGSGEIGEYGVVDRPKNGSWTNDSAVFILNQSNNTTANRLRFSRADDATWSETDLLDPYPDTVTTDTHRVRMEYDAPGSAMRFSVDFDYDGAPFASDFVSDWLDVSDLADSTGWGGGENASIFFGGDSDAGSDSLPTLARDFTVVPEPMTMTLVTMGGLLLLVRRRH